MEAQPLTAAERVAQLIKSLDISSYQFGKETGLSHQTISNVLTGKNKPSLDTLEAIAARYPDTAVWLLTGKGEPRTGVMAQLPPAVPSKAAEPAPTPGYDIMAVNRITPEEAVAIQLENARLKQELETQRQLIAELRADKGQLWKQNAILLEKKPEASVEAAPLTDTVDELAHQLFNPAAHKEVAGFQTQGQRLRLA